MRAIKSISRIFSVLLVTLSLSFGALGVAHAQAPASTGLSAADWKQIKALMPAATIDAQQAYLKASNTGTSDNFGAAMSISGDTLVVGADFESSNATGVDGDQNNNLAVYSGAVYVFTRSGSAWSQQAYIKASNTGANDGFGANVAISGDTLVVGAPGEDSNTVGVNGNQNDNSAADSGAVYVFTRNGGVWSQQAYVKASNTGADDYFGSAVAISGDTLVVGTPRESSNATGVNGAQNNDLAPYSGAAYIFTRNGNLWNQQTYIKASNTGTSDKFGAAVAISGNTLVVGAPYEDSSATGVNGDQADNSTKDSGAAYIFTRNGSAIWSQQTYLKASDTSITSQFGYSVAVSANTVAVGANTAFVQGEVYIFTNSGSAWSQQANLSASNAGYEDLFGESVAISGDTLVVGAILEDSNATGVNGDQTDDSVINSGAAYVFIRNGNTWGQQAYVKASNTDKWDHFGSSVAISNGTIMVGATGESSKATGVGGDQENNSASYSGAAYVLALPPLAVSSLPNDHNPTAAASVNFTLTFSEPVTGVDARDLALTTTDSITSASIKSVSGGPTAYTVAVATGLGEGTICLDVLDNDSILSVASNTPLGGTGAGNGNFTSGQAYTIDRSGPTVLEMWWLSPSPADTGVSADLMVRFSEDVTGVDVSDFHLTTKGVTGAAVTDVTPEPDNASRYVVTIKTGLHIGTIRLDLVDNDSIRDLASNPLGGVGAGNGNFTAPIYIADRTFTMMFNSTTAQDGWVLESSENSNLGGKMNATAKTFQLGDDAANRQYRAILSFDTRSLPDNAIIQDAVLKIFQSGAVVGKNPFNVLGKLWADIRKGPFGTAALQLSDFSAPASAKKVGYFTDRFDGYTGALNAIGRKNINKLGLTQFRLYFALDDNNNRKADFMKFVAYYTLGNAPKLTITYAVP